MSASELEKSAAELDAITNQAAAAYYDNAVRFGIGKYPRGGVRKSRNWTSFQRVARICISKGIDASEFVTCAFAAAMERHAIVTVKDIVAFKTEDMRRAEEDVERSSPKDLWNLLSCKLLDIVFSSNGKANTTDILNNPIYGFPAWFRVFSPDTPVDEIIVNWGDIAAEELKESPKLGEFLRKKRTETHRLLSSVVAKI